MKPDDSLPVSPLEIPGTAGLVGMYGILGRDPETDLKAIRNWGAELLLSLVDDSEYRGAGIADIESLIPSGMALVRLPIPDMGVPGDDWERGWARTGPRLRDILRRGGRVCIHCMGGRGRTGLVAARILIEFGMHPDRAIAAVRRARPGAIETQEQERYLRSLENQKWHLDT
jgi:protein-tyrosine phosphatase